MSLKTQAGSRSVSAPSPKQKKIISMLMENTTRVIPHHPSYSGRKALKHMAESLCEILNMCGSISN